jgi:carbonic anhydrase
MKRSRFILALVLVAAFSAMVYAGMGGEEAWKSLLDGNGRFVSGKPAAKDFGEAKRTELAAGQHPFATVVACSDSRVAPELLFDRGLGEIFVVRTAGNVVDPIAIGSIEYGVEHLHTPLLVILGHESCGAVKAAMEAGGEPEGNIGAIIKKIRPSIEKAKAAGSTDKGRMMETAIQENMRHTYDDILMNSSVIAGMMHEGKLKVVLAEYYLGTGKVEVIEKQKVN